MTTLETAYHMDDPTLAEVYRAIMRIEQLQIATNGRIYRMEMESVRTEQRMLLLEEAHDTCPILRPSLASRSGPERTDWKRVVAGIAVIGGAVWLAVDLLFRAGDWLHTVGLR